MQQQDTIDTSEYQQWTHRSLARTLREAYKKQIETGQRESVLILGDTCAGKSAAVDAFCDAMVDELKLNDARKLLDCENRYVQADLNGELSSALEKNAFAHCFFQWKWKPHRTLDFLAECPAPHGVVVVDWSSLTSEGRSQVTSSLKELESRLPPQVLIVAVLLSPETHERAKAYYQAADWPSLQLDERGWKAFEACFQIKGILKVDPQEWFEDVAQGRIDPVIIDFIKRDPVRLLGLDSEHRRGKWSFSTPASVVGFSQLFDDLREEYEQDYEGGEVTLVPWYDAVEQLAGECLGPEWAFEFSEFLKARDS